jgi:hypothetical protein
MLGKIKSALVEKNRQRIVSLVAELNQLEPDGLPEEVYELLEELNYYILSTQDREEAITRYKAKQMGAYAPEREGT